MEFTVALRVLISFTLILATHQAKKPDPYKVLGVDHEASQRDIQKAFHKLSLQYHPDKNKNKGAQEKFAEINNAYEILGDEQKRKNYDTYGDENGHPGFHGGDGGYTFTGGNWGQNGYSYSNNFHNSKAHSFSFSFGGPGSGMPFDFGMNDFFNMFGGNEGHSYSESSYHSNVRNRISDIKSDDFLNDGAEEGITYIILSFSPSSKNIESYESVIHEVSDSLKGALKARKMNCENEASFCKAYDINPRRNARIFVFSYKVEEDGSFVEYKGDLVAKDLKSFCQEHLPRFSKRMDVKNIESLPRKELLPGVLLLSSKKDTPVIWRVLSGLHRKRFSFYDMQVDDVSHPSVKELGVGALPAVVGWTVTGERLVLVSGIPAKDLKTTVEELGTALDDLERKNKRTGNSVGRVNILTRWNLETHCGEGTPVCVMGVYRSEKSKEKLWFIASQVSHTSLGRHVGGRDPVVYALVNGTKHQTFLDSFERTGFRKLDELVLAYKPRTSKYAVFEGEVSMEEVERFIASVLNGDLRFSKTSKKPAFK